MSHSIGCVKDNLYRLSVQSDTSYENTILEAMEAKLYYLRDTCTPVEFEALVDAEIQRLREKSQEEPHFGFKDLMRSLKKKAFQICH